MDGMFGNEFDESFKNDNMDMYDDKDDWDTDPDTEPSIKKSNKDFKKLYHVARKLSRDFDVNISIPEFVFCGYQTSGKTSVVAQVAQFVVGIMKNGTASRCPLRFIMRNAPNKKITYGIEGQGIKKSCNNEDELMKVILQHNNDLDKKKIFDPNIFEIEITGPDIFDFILTDCPGLFKAKSDDNDSKLKAKCIEEMQARFINEIDRDGNYRYVPVLVRTCEDLKNDDQSDMDYIDRIIKANQYEHPYTKQRGYRRDWKDHAIYIQNKFDLQCNVSNAKELCVYIDELIKRQRNTIITSMNANGDKTGMMDMTQLKYHVNTRIEQESKFYNTLLNKFIARNDPDVPRLKRIIKKYVGIQKMRDILDNKIESIVNKIGPDILNKVRAQEAKLKNEMSIVDEKLNNTNPDRLRDEINEFNTQLLRNLERYLKGLDVSQLKGEFPDICQTWNEQMNDFKNSEYYYDPKFKLHSWMTDYYINPKKLHNMLSDIDPKSELITLNKSKLNGSSKYHRLLSNWEAYIALIKFPEYSDERIITFNDYHSYTLGGDPWSIIRHYLKNAVKSLKDSVLFLSQGVLHLILYDLERVYQYTLNKMYPTIGSANNIESLLKVGYNMLIELFKNMVNEFKISADVVPENSVDIVDENFPQKVMNCGHVMKIEFEYIAVKLSELYPKKYKKCLTKRFENIDKLYHNKYKSKKKQSWVSKTIKNIIASQKDLIKDDKKKDNDGDDPNDSDSDEKEDPNVFNDDQIIKDKYDVIFYSLVFSSDLLQPLYIGTKDPDIIRKVGKSIWLCIKQNVMTEIQQKFLHEIIYPLRQQDDEQVLRNAIDTGVKRKKLKHIITKLSKLIQINEYQLKQLIDNELKKTNKILPKPAKDYNINDINKILDPETKKLGELKIKLKYKYEQFKQTKNDLMKQLKLFHQI